MAQLCIYGGLCIGCNDCRPTIDEEELEGATIVTIIDFYDPRRENEDE